MDYRVGTCSSCRQSYRIPAAFRPNRARCKNCGGVVSIAAAPAPAQNGAPPAAPTHTDVAPPAPLAPAAAMETPPEPVAEVVVEAPVPRESARSVPSAPPQVARARRLRPLHVVAWAAAVAIVVACWFVFSSGQPSTAADSRQADTTAPVEEAPRTGE